MKATLLLACALCAMGVWFVGTLEQRQASVSAKAPALENQTYSSVGRKHVVPRHRDGHFYLNTSVEGRPISFMVDSGASHVMLSASDAQRLGRMVRKRDLVHEFHTANGVNKAAKITLAQVRIGGRDFANVDAYIIPEGLGVSLMGQSLLSRFAAVEMRQDQLELRW
ncbi:MAG: TIGR02281 family clan AA aspartic protease [Sphingomonadales bacterium]